MLTGGFPQGFAFVQFAEATEAATAIEKLHGALVYGHTFKVSLAHASSPKGKKKDTAALLPSGKRARDDRGDKTAHASKRTGAAKSSQETTTQQTSGFHVVQSVVSDMVQQIVDLTAATSLKSSPSTTSLKRKDSDADLCVDGSTHTFNKRQTSSAKPSSIMSHHQPMQEHQRPRIASEFEPRKMPKRPPPPSMIRSCQPPPPPPCGGTRLFVTSLYEYTHQELHAMFHVYGDFSHVQMVHCQGKLHTMAYVQYTTASTAQYVVESFSSDRSLLSVCFADETKQTSRIMLNWLEVGFAMATSTLTTIVSQCDGMEFVDIIPIAPVPTGSVSVTTSGRCNVKFTNEVLARAAFGYLRTLPSIVSLQLIPDPTSSYDVDIRAVESQFAHLMSTPYYPTPPMPVQAPAVASSDDELLWLHVASPAPCTWSGIQSVVTPVPVLDLIVDGGDGSDDDGARKGRTSRSSTDKTMTHDGDVGDDAPGDDDVSTRTGTSSQPTKLCEAWVQFASPKHALMAMNTLLRQDSIAQVSVAQLPPPIALRRHAKKAKRWM
ncbi:hypothetical protein, variant 2 [Aphanomyces invadans]|uniref:RRM domain-containing protein n=1 Tax=Aphanomyces invadans TaxID=157072 RepID=A0A024TC43_9STRA|nr:hypothetical protein, variant 2 [Aphanomyces invadans]ETV91171.1 hypothetical protein, variant 2 [Aphanomyces invadans]|eukprot:XP_008880201.1 hypothetical protein, variant 2 [Aphanomyces invadans]